MTTLHGCFSLGAMLGAMLGTLMAWLQVPVMHHLLGVVVVGGVLTAPLVRRVENLSAVKAAVGGHGDAGDAGHGGFVLNAFKDPRVLLIGLFALGLALTEGAAHDWLPLLMVDGYQFSNAQGTLIYMLFTLGVTVARLGGQWLLQRFTRLALMRASAVLAGSGLLVVVFAQSPVLGAIAPWCCGGWALRWAFRWLCPPRLKGRATAHSAWVRWHRWGMWLFWWGHQRWVLWARCGACAWPCCRWWRPAAQPWC